MASTNKFEKLKHSQCGMYDNFIMGALMTDKQMMDTAVGELCNVKQMDLTSSAKAVRNLR